MGINVAESVSPATVGLPRIETHEVRRPRGAAPGGRIGARSTPLPAVAKLGRSQVPPQASDERKLIAPGSAYTSEGTTVPHGTGGRSSPPLRDERPAGTEAAVGATTTYPVASTSGRSETFTVTVCVPTGFPARSRTLNRSA